MEAQPTVSTGRWLAQLPASIGRWLMQLLKKVPALSAIGGICWLYYRGIVWAAILAETSCTLLIAAYYQYFVLPSRERAPIPNVESSQNDTRAPTPLVANGPLVVNGSTHDDNAIESLAPRDEDVQAVATVVGWREDPVWYTKCLNSLKHNRNCELVVAGIDGNEPEDEKMVDIFQKVRFTAQKDDFHSDEIRTNSMVPGLPRGRSRHARDTIFATFGKHQEGKRTRRQRRRPTTSLATSPRICRLLSRR